MATIQDKPMADHDADAPGTPELPSPPTALAADGHGHGLGIYKSGQGYWTRVCTAIGLAFILLSAIAWAWEQCKLVDIPVHEWSAVIEGSTGQVKPGETVKLAAPPKTDGGPPTPLATARVREASNAGPRTTITLEGAVFTGASTNLREAKQVTSEDGVSFTARLASIDAIPAFPMIYLQATVAAAMAIVGAGLIFWLVGRRHRSVDFLIATDAEMKKVNWSSRKTIMDSTWMVVMASVLISALIYIIDFIFQWFFALVGVLDR
jgi:preprotein translocase SecE subunit